MDSSKSPFDDPEFSGKSESATVDASSATAIFGTVSAKPAPQQDDDLLKSLMGAQNSPTPNAEPSGSTSPVPPQSQMWTPAVPRTPPRQAAPSSAPGEFTEIFQALQSPASASTPAAPPTAASNTPPKAPADLANVFTQVVVEKTIFTPPPAPSPSSPKAGEFTQLLQTLNASTKKPEPEVAASPQPAAAAPPGTFTQLLNTVSTPPSEAPQTSAMPAAHSPAPQVPQPFRPDTPAAPGDFTRMFQAAPGAGQTMSSPIAPSTPGQPASGPGSFTQMFSAKPMESTPSEDPLKSLKAEPPPPNTFQFSSPARPQEGMPPAQGGFTQLLQALNKEEPARPAEPLIASPPLQPAPAVPASGGFTQLLQTLSADPASKQAAQPPVMPPVQPAPAAPSMGGPGEFTRIISGSQLRDLQTQSVPPVAPQQAARLGVPPMQFPQAPAFPAPPAMPQMHGQMPAAHSAAAPPAAMPHFQPPAFQFPPAPAPAAPPPAPSKLQQYLPLILILNVFVLVVIVLILIFVLRHR